MRRKRKKLCGISRISTKEIMNWQYWKQLLSCFSFTQKKEKPRRKKIGKSKSNLQIFHYRSRRNQKDGETIEIPGKMTVAAFIEFMSEKYGYAFSKNVYAEGTIQGKKFKTPNIYLNKKRIQWVQDFPKGLKPWSRMETSSGLVWLSAAGTDT